MVKEEVLPHHCCLMSGFILIAGIGLICVGVLVYKPYTEAKFYISTRCSIVEKMKSTKAIYKGDDEEDEIVDCIYFTVVYDKPADVNTTDDIEATGYLSMNEASAGKEGSVNMHIYVEYWLIELRNLSKMQFTLVQTPM